MWIRFTRKRAVNPKKATQIKATRGGYRIDFSHPSLRVTVDFEDEVAYSQVRSFLQDNTERVHVETSPDHPHNHREGH